MQKNHRTKLVLFDLDGTLVDTAPDFLESLNNVLRNHNKECVSMDVLRPYISEGTSKLIKLFFKINENDKNFNLYKDQFLSEYESNLKNNSTLFNGMSDFIKFLDKESIKYGVVTNKHYKYAQPILDSFLELKNIQVLICPDHVKISKPDPEGILLACKKLDIKPENTYLSW
jgi:Predicted phosphatases